MKNRTSVVIFGVLIILALLGMFSLFTAKSAGSLTGTAIIALIGIVIYLIVRRFSTTSPQRTEQRAFLKAAKKSKKRLQHKSGESGVKVSSLGNLATLKKPSKIKKKSPAHLTVIDGKKGKKKNRASF